MSIFMRKQKNALIVVGQHGDVSKEFTSRKQLSKRMGYYDGDSSCGQSSEITKHMMNLLAQPCTLDDRHKFNDIVKICWRNGKDG